MYVLRGGPFERFLYFDSEHYWRVGSCEYKDQDTYGSFGIFGECDQSFDHIRWTCRLDIDWMMDE